MQELFLKPETCFAVVNCFDIFLASSIRWGRARGTAKGRLEVLPVLFPNYTIYEEVYTGIYDDSSIGNIGKCSKGQIQNNLLSLSNCVLR